MSEKIFLGIDTSCYTTSLAAINETGQLVAQVRRLLRVKQGTRGLQQSEMVFQHVRNLPDLMEELLSGAGHEIISVTASGYPRPVEGSYMPAFLAGCGLARSLAAAHGAVLNIISHQENHLEAGLWSAGGPESGRFLLLHASGGTTDLLLTELGGDGRYRLSKIGGSIDLHAGQFIDRIGVALGLSFPAGPSLEKLAAAAGKFCELPVSVRNAEASLSGPATAAMRKLEAGADPAELALGVERVLAETFSDICMYAAFSQGVKDVLFVGGVGCNSFIRAHVGARLAAAGVRLHVPDIGCSGDNAVGCAAFGWRTKIGR